MTTAECVRSTRPSSPTVTTDPSQVPRPRGPRGAEDGREAAARRHRALNYVKKVSTTPADDDHGADRRCIGVELAEPSGAASKALAWQACAVRVTNPLKEQRVRQQASLVAPQRHVRASFG
jgi:hypothetical protein